VAARSPTRNPAVQVIMAKPKELMRLVAPEGECSYLPWETSSLEYRLIVAIDTADYAELVRRGWRRHGVHFFRPACPACVKCRSLRIDVERFRPTKSQRRTRKRNEHVTFEVAEPEVTHEHVRLFNAYHQSMTEHKGWRENRTTPDDYFQSFLAGDWEFDAEFRYRIDGELVGVGLVDLLPDALTSVYFYHHPRWRPMGPGTFSLLREIEFARATGRRHVYLGYWISECASMTYKANFGPHELLLRYPADDEPPEWCPRETITATWWQPGEIAP
jgi:leucyl-tRNA---protein transferase